MRWAAATEFAGRASAEPEEAQIATFPSEVEALLWLGDGVLDGWAPEGLYDLDTGQRIELHVSTPVVSRSEDQGCCENPLEGQ
jgi:hypothetical protein